MDLMNSIRKLRQEKHSPQEELAHKLGVHQKQISAYERGINITSIELLIKMSELFYFSLDYLAFEAKRR